MDNSKNSIVISICLGVFFLIILGVGIVKILPAYIFNKMDCSTFSIDQVELRTGINIPKIKSINCVCVSNLKDVSFVIDDSKVDIDEYLAKHDFVNNGNVLEKEAENNYSKFIATFNPENNQVSIKIWYLANVRYV